MSVSKNVRFNFYINTKAVKVLLDFIIHKIVLAKLFMQE